MVLFQSCENTRTCALFLLSERRPETLDGFLQVVLLFFHVLNGLVPFREQALKPSDLGQQSATNFECELCAKPCKYTSTPMDN
jgi:hypothetical protein